MRRVMWVRWESSEASEVIKVGEADGWEGISMKKAK